MRRKRAEIPFPNSFVLLLSPYIITIIVIISHKVEFCKSFHQLFIINLLFKEPRVGKPPQSFPINRRSIINPYPGRTNQIGKKSVLFDPYSVGGTQIKTVKRAIDPTMLRKTPRAHIPLDSTDQHALRIPLFSRDHVKHMIHSVAKINVGMPPGKPERAVTLGLPA